MTKTVAEKTFEELTPEDMKEVKVEFAPGCFDNFEGTQEELEELIAHITEMFASGEALDNSTRIVSLEELMEEDPEYAEELMQRLSEDGDNTQRKLH